MTLPDVASAHSVEDLATELHRLVVAGHLDPAGDRSAVLDELRRLAPLLGAAEEVQVLAKVADRVAGLGSLASLLGSDDITDVLVNGPGRVWVEQQGSLVETDVVIGEDEIRRIVERITAPSGRRVDLRNPIVDLRLLDGSRAHVVLPPVAVDGPYLTIRRFGPHVVPLGDFAPAEVVELLVQAIDDRCNLVVSGGTGSGKTTLLNALCGHLGPSERTVTIEDAAELRLPGDQVVRLECRPETSDGLTAVTIGDLVRASLRMRPDRLIVGEVRGSEAIDMLWAMNTGHDGSMTTCHANSPVDALRRLEAMALSARSGLDGAGIRQRIHTAVDLIVQLGRRSDGRRHITSIVEPALSPDLGAIVGPIADADGVVGERSRPSRRIV